MSVVFKLLTVAILAALLNGCVALKSVSVTPIPEERGNKVSVKVERLIILGFNFDNDYVDDLSKKLAQSCPSGVVKGVLTKHEEIFYGIGHKVRIIAEGFCVNETNQT